MLGGNMNTVSKIKYDDQKEINGLKGLCCTKIS